MVAVSAVRDVVVMHSLPKDSFSPFNRMSSRSKLLAGFGIVIFLCCSGLCGLVTTSTVLRSVGLMPSRMPALVELGGEIVATAVSIPSPTTDPTPQATTTQPDTSSSAVPDGDLATVTRVIDGDTIEVWVG